jgi:molecular chaperone DnaJ
MKIPISFAQAALGDEVTITTLEGKHVELKIPAETQTNTTLRLRALGMPKLDAVARGDLYAKVVVQTPRNLTDKQKEQLRQVLAGA